MAKPQKEDGHTDIANELLEAFSRVNLSPYEWRVVFCILRKTYGWHRKADRIALSQIGDMTRLLKPHVCRAKQRLLKKCILIEQDGKLGLQKDYEQWVVTYSGNVTSSGNKSLPAPVTSVTSSGNKSLPVQAPQKKIKKPIQKKEYRPNSEPFRLSQLLLDLILAHKPDFCRPNLQTWAKYVDQMIRLNHRTPERIEELMRWVQADGFEQVNVLSTQKLKLRFDQLEMKMNRSLKKRESVQNGKQKYDRGFAGQTSSIGSAVEM